MIGNIIREARLNKNMNQEELAKCIGCSLNTVSRWENNHNVPSLYEMQKITKALNVIFSIYGDEIQLTVLQEEKLMI